LYIRFAGANVGYSMYVLFCFKVFSIFFISQFRPERGFFKFVFGISQRRSFLYGVYFKVVLPEHKSCHIVSGGCFGNENSGGSIGLSPQLGNSCALAACLWFLASSNTSGTQPRPVHHPLQSLSSH
jgi:hypothetical protein